MPEDNDSNARHFKRIDEALITISAKLDSVVELSIHTRFQDQRLDQHQTRLNSHSKKIDTLQQANAAYQPQVKRNSDWMEKITMLVLGGLVGGIIKTLFG